MRGREILRAMSFSYPATVCAMAIALAIVVSEDVRA
jgi:hypothetical protein